MPTQVQLKTAKMVKIEPKSAVPCAKLEAVTVTVYSDWAGRFSSAAVASVPLSRSMVNDPASGPCSAYLKQPRIGHNNGITSPKTVTTTDSKHQSARGMVQMMSHNDVEVAAYWRMLNGYESASTASAYSSTRPAGALCST